MSDADREEGAAVRGQSPLLSRLGNRSVGQLARAAGSPQARRALARALLQREPQPTTQQMHEQIYGEDPSTHHPARVPGSAPSTPPPPATAVPTPVITTKPPNLFAPLPPSVLAPKGEWLEDALKRDPLLRALPDWAREKAIKGLKDADETVAEKIIGALPWDEKQKEAVSAALKALLQTAKGKTWTPPPSPARQPDWGPSPSFPQAPGEKIFWGPSISW